THVLLAQHFQHVVQVGVGHFGAQALDVDRLETGNGELGEDFEDGDEFQVLALLEGLRLYRGGASRVQLLLDHGFIEGSLDQVTEGFLTGGVFVTLTDHAHRHFARTEAWNLGATGSLLQTLVDFGLDALGRNGDGHATLESGSVFNRNLHGYSSLHRR